METLISGKDVLELIPQRAPMVMIDTFYGITENSSYSGLTIQKDNIFCENNIFQEAGIIEHIAQSAAARVGYICMRKNETVPAGFIVSIDKLHIYNLPETGESLVTGIEIINDYDDFTVIEAEVKRSGKIIAEGSMKIVLNNEKKNY